MTTADRHALTLLAADALADTMPPEDLLDAVGELNDLTDDEFAALFDEQPATFGDLAARPAPVPLPVAEFSEAPADKQFSLPGPAGERAYNLMAHLRAEGTRTLYRLAERAVSRLVADPAAAQSAYTLFDDDELAELKQSLAATVAAADMLGRARIAQLAAMKAAPVKTFAEGDEFAAFAEPVPPRPPLEALDYFRKLVPSLDNDPLRYGPLLDRHAFTLAYATDQTMLESVKRALLANLAGQTESANLIAGLEGERNVRGAELVQSILDRAGVSPRNDSYSSMVYRTNTLDAYHQGMQRELAKPEVQEMFPAWRYLGIKDGREGDDHRPNFGRVYPVTMPFTEARGPRPWNCRCSSQPLDKDELKLFIDAGGVVETTPQYGRG